MNHKLQCKMQKYKTPKISHKGKINNGGLGNDFSDTTLKT